jgi:hypothetical protein
LARFVKLVATTDQPPESIVSEMAKLEAEKVAEKVAELELARELDALTSRRASLTEASTEFKFLIAKGDMPSRLRLREELRRRIDRIDIFPNGADKAKHFPDEPVRDAPGMPAFKTTFSNGATRWMFCSSRNPEGATAAILDGPPPAGMELELRERPEISYKVGKKSGPSRNVTVPVFVPTKSIRNWPASSRKAKNPRRPSSGKRPK